MKVSGFKGCHLVYVRSMGVSHLKIIGSVNGLTRGNVDRLLHLLLHLHKFRREGGENLPIRKI